MSKEPFVIMILEAVELFTEESDDYYEEPLEHEATAQVIVEELNGNIIYEGAIQVYLETHRWNMDSNEFQDSQTFDSFKDALNFINVCLDEWGFDFNLRATDFRMTYRRKRRE